MRYRLYLCACLALCLCLWGCAAPSAPTGETAAPTAPAEDYVPHHTDPARRGLQAQVAFSSDTYAPLGRLNNRYAQQAQKLYETLGVDRLTVSHLQAPKGAAWVRLSFSYDVGGRAEVFTLYDNNFVAVSHPARGAVNCVATPGTYEAVLAYLEQVRTDQSRYVTLTAEYANAEGYFPASYTLYDKDGQQTDRVLTGTDTVCAELVAEGLVRITQGDTVRLYETATGRDRTLTARCMDVAADRVVAARGDVIEVYSLFGTTPLCRVYVAQTEDNPTPVEAVSLSADGRDLHVVMGNAGGSHYDRTLALQEEIDGSVLRILGDWRTTLTPATEKEEQTEGYDILRKLRHRESGEGYTLSTTLLGHLTVGDTPYLLCEVGHWIEDAEGRVVDYKTVGHLMVTRGRTAGYAATLEQNELRWDTADNWFKK